MITPLGNGKQYNIQKLDEQPGLYFTKKFQFVLSTEFWTISIDINLDDLEDKLTQIHAIWDEVVNLKTNLKTIGSSWQDAHFQETRDVIRSTELKVKRLYEVLGTSPEGSRNKRGLVNTIGTGLKTLFGTMDSDDAEYYNEKISTLDSNQHRVYQLEKDQLTVVKNTLSDVTHTFRDFKMNQDTIIKTQDYLEQLQNLSNKQIVSIQEQMDCHYKVIGALQIIELTCRDVDSLVNDLYVGIDSMRNNKLSTLLVDPDSLIKNLRDIEKHLRTRSTLPIVVTPETIHEYYSLIRVTAWIVNGHILRFFLNIPLRQSERVFTLYEVMALPTRTVSASEQPLFTFVQSQVDYIAVSRDEQRFIQMSQRQIDQCRGESIKLCLNPNIVNNVISGQETCEMAYYHNIQPPKDVCETRIAYLPTSIWTELGDTNQWIFVLPREEILTITCPGEDGLPSHEGTEWVIGTGLLSLPAKCQMIGASFRIYSRVNFKSKTTFNISQVVRIPNIKYSRDETVTLSNETYERIARKLKNLTSHIKTVSHSLNDLKSASIRLDTLDSILKQFEPNNYVSYETHYMSLTALFCILIFVVYYFKLYKLCKTKKREYFAVMFKSKTNNEQVENDLDDVPLEDRIRITNNRRS